jgi:uncharacterized protein (DUF302 family)
VISQSFELTVDEVVKRLVDSIAAAPLALVAHINGQANAAKRGFSVPPDQILEVFRPDLAVRVWEADKRAGIEIPLRIHVYESAGKAVVSHRPPSEVFGRYENAALDAISRDLAPLFERVFAPLQPYAR